MQDQTKTTQNKITERREYFRVEDLLPTSIKKIDEDTAKMMGKTIPGLQSGIGCPGGIEETPEESINPVLWRMLTEINRKLTVLMDNMHLASQGLTNIQVKKVSISASGMRVICDEGFEPEDCVEIKILITANTSFWLVLYGRVMRVTQTLEARWEVGVEFFEMGDEVRNALSAYMISRQREMIQKSEWKEVR
ncbi:MAG: PilZ domain-containing protein [Deltaproteobacteria bacterium]|nr:PilZ domain-containing protein [Deltaproteobacteria bacterium]